MAGADWFPSVVAGQSVLTSVTEQNGHVRWIVAQPVLNAFGQPEGAVIGNLNAAVLPDVLNPELRKGERMVATTRTIASSTTRRWARSMVTRPFFEGDPSHTVVYNTAVTLALVGRAGNANFRDLGGQPVVGGFDTVEGLGWAVTVVKARGKVLAPVTSQQRTAIIVILFGAAGRDRILGAASPAAPPVRSSASRTWPSE